MRFTVNASANATPLGVALKVNGTLATIDLGSNSIGDEGAVAIADALKVNNT